MKPIKSIMSFFSVINAFRKKYYKVFTIIISIIPIIVVILYFPEDVYNFFAKSNTNSLYKEIVFFLLLILIISKLYYRTYRRIKRENISQNHKDDKVLDTFSIYFNILATTLTLFLVGITVLFIIKQIYLMVDQTNLMINQTNEMHGQSASMIKQTNIMNEQTILLRVQTTFSNSLMIAQLGDRSMWNTPHGGDFNSYYLLGIFKEDDDTPLLLKENASIQINRVNDR